MNCAKFANFYRFCCQNSVCKTASSLDPTGVAWAIAPVMNVEHYHRHRGPDQQTSWSRESACRLLSSTSTSIVI